MQSLSKKISSSRGVEMLDRNRVGITRPTTNNDGWGGTKKEAWDIINFPKLFMAKNDFLRQDKTKAMQTLNSAEHIWQVSEPKI